MNSEACSLTKSYMERMGEISTQTVNAIRQAMARARAADGTGDKAACEQALAEVRALLVSSLRTTLMASADCAAEASRSRRRGDRMNRRELFVSFLSPSNRHFLH